MCLRGMQESALSDNERDRAAPVRFALRLKTPIRGSFEGEKDGTHMPTTGRLIARRADNGRYVGLVGGQTVQSSALHNACGTIPAL